jgi:hypothetical protein
MASVAMASVANANDEPKRQALKPALPRTEGSVMRHDSKLVRFAMVKARSLGRALALAVPVALLLTGSVAAAEVKKPPPAAAEVRKEPAPAAV